MSLTVFTKTIFQERRKLFQQQMEANSLAIFFSANVKLRSRDVHYPYRPDSDFFYLTGLAEPEAVLVLCNDKQQLYLRPRDPKVEQWEGKRLGLEGAFSTTGIEEALPIRQFSQDLEKLLAGYETLYYRFGVNTKQDWQLLHISRNLSNKGRQRKHGPSRVICTDTILHKMRMIKSDQELQLLREIAQITANGHLRLLQTVTAGMYEYELAAHLDYEFGRCNAVQAYPPIVATGSNACTLHYTDRNCQIKEDDVILVDAAAEKYCLATDVTRSFPAGKKFSALQRDVYDIVLEAQQKAIAAAVVGSTLPKIHGVAVLTLIEGLIEMKVLSGKAEDHWQRAQAIEKLNDPQKLGDIPYRRYFMHQCSHWLGMDVHDAGSYYQDGKPIILRAGMVCTVEPGLYFAPDDITVREELRGLGIRIEDDICIQEKKALVLTEAIPKQVGEIQQIRAGIA